MKSPKVKICGITREEDAEFAIEQGADYIGMIHFQGSPRCVDEVQASALMGYIPSGKRVYVNVAPEPEDLQRVANLGFDYFQIHFDPSLDVSILQTWSSIVGPERLWLAPRVPEDGPFPKQTLALADTILLDTFQENAFGGSGETGDWDVFWALKEAYTKTNWVLAGGLSPDNIIDALTASHADTVDVNSGVEVSPGIKDPHLIAALFDQIRFAHEES